jgi:uncharacterized protein YkwD
MARWSHVQSLRNAAAAVLCAGLVAAAVTSLRADDEPVSTVAATADATPATRPWRKEPVRVTTSAAPSTTTPVTVAPPVTEAPIAEQPPPTTRPPTTTTAAAPPPTGPPPTEPPPAPEPGVVLAAAEQTILGLVNGVRATIGLGALSPSGHITRVARQWAQQMAAAGSLSHNPSYFSQILAGVDCDVVAENVAYRRPGDAAAIHQQLMASAGHAANVLDGSFSLIGIGAVSSTDGTLWVVQNFCG